MHLGTFRYKCTMLMLHVKHAAMFLVIIFFCSHSISIDKCDLEKVTELQKSLQQILSQLTRLRRQHSYLLEKIKTSPWLINKPSAPPNPASLALLAEDPGPTEEFEHLRRRIYSNTKELWYYVNYQLKKLSRSAMLRHELSTVLDEIAVRKRSLLSDQEKLVKLDGYLEWRQQEAASVSKLVQRRLARLQNPPDCRAANIVVAHHDVCGFGCDHHHLTYCLIFAYATRRTLIVLHSNWNYRGKNNRPWTEMFHNLSQNCTSLHNSTVIKFKGRLNHRVLYLPRYSQSSYRGLLKILPHYMPEDLVFRIVRFNGDPRSWWIGQMLKYVQKPLSDVQAVIDEVLSNLTILSPTVGIHVRRTDKLRSEAALHDLSEYMSHVEDYFAQLELTTVIDKRRVYLATDDPKVFREAVSRYPQYSFYDRAWHDWTMASHSRFSPDALTSLLVDLHALARCDYGVFTFSSNVGRMVYEMMQASRVDASNSVYSLDREYYFNTGEPCYRLSVMRHYGGPYSVPFYAGDLIKRECWKRSPNGTVVSDNITGPIPWYKTSQYLLVHPFPKYENVL